MPRSTREWAKRKLQQAKNNIDWSGYHIVEVAEKYKDAHPEIAGPLYNVAGMLLAVQKIIDNIEKSF